MEVGEEREVKFQGFNVSWFQGLASLSSLLAAGKASLGSGFQNFDLLRSLLMQLGLSNNG
jgi:hypothetical protein